MEIKTPNVRFAEIDIRLYETAVFFFYFNTTKQLYLQIIERKHLSTQKVNLYLYVPYFQLLSPRTHLNFHENHVALYSYCWINKQCKMGLFLHLYVVSLL